MRGFFVGQPGLHRGGERFTWRLEQLEQLEQQLERQQVQRLHRQQERRLGQQQERHQQALVLEQQLVQEQQAQRLLLFCRKRTKQQQR
jgi:hypothetical protein